MSGDEPEVLSLGGLSFVEEDVAEPTPDARRVGLGLLSVLILIAVVAVIIVAVVFVAVLIWHFGMLLLSSYLGP